MRVYTTSDSFYSYSKCVCFALPPKGRPAPKPVSKPKPTPRPPRAPGR